MKAPSIPKTLVELGRAVELDTTTWLWTWNKKDNYVVASNADGNRLFIFPKPKKGRNNPECKTGMQVQTYLFADDHWTDVKAKKWLKSHKAKTPKADHKGEYLRYRQAPPSHYKRGSFRTKTIDKKRGIKAVVACPLAKYALNPAETRGKRLFKLFNRRSSDEIIRGKVKDRTKRGGKAIHIIYNSDKFGKKENFIHSFDTWPNVFVDNFKKPSMIVLKGGRIKITSRGIEG